MTNKEFKEKISQLFGYFDNTEFGDIISFTRAGKEEEAMNLIREVIESIIPEKATIIHSDNKREVELQNEFNYVRGIIKDNLDKLFKSDEQ